MAVGAPPLCSRNRDPSVMVKSDRVLRAVEVAEIFRVNPKTVTRWAEQGKIPYFRTLGGHRRFYEADVLAALDKATEH